MKEAVHFVADRVPAFVRFLLNSPVKRLRHAVCARFDYVAIFIFQANPPAFLKGDFMKPIVYNVNVTWDDEAHVWVAIANDIPLALEGGSYDALIERVKTATPEILEMNSKPSNPISLRFTSDRLVTSG